VHYLSVVVFGKVVWQFDRQNGRRLLRLDGVVMQALKATVVERRRERK